MNIRSHESHGYTLLILGNDPHTSTTSGCPTVTFVAICQLSSLSLRIRCRHTATMVIASEFSMLDRPDDMYWTFRVQIWNGL